MSDDILLVTGVTLRREGLTVALSISCCDGYQAIACYEKMLLGLRAGNAFKVLADETVVVEHADNG